MIIGPDGVGRCVVFLSFPLMGSLQIGLRACIPEGGMMPTFSTRWLRHDSCFC